MGAFYDWSKDQYLSGQEPNRTASAPRQKIIQPVHPAPEQARMPRQTASTPSRKQASCRRKQTRRRNKSVAVALLCVLALFLWWPWSSKKVVSAQPEEPEVPVLPHIVSPGPPDSEEAAEPAAPVVPDWVEQAVLPLNEYSRPGTPLSQVNGVVVHYVGNPGTTAKQNRSYYASLAETHETWASSHFVIDTDGTVIQCVPLNEIAYCSNNRNFDTISIECCHLDSDGAFTPETEESLTRLLNWLIDTYGLGREDILRHYDITGKECPRYFVQHPDEWEGFLNQLTFPSSA